MAHTLDTTSDRVTLGPAKAIVAAVAAGVVAGGTSLVTALSDNIITPAEWITALIAVIVGAGLTGTVTYAKATTVTLN